MKKKPRKNVKNQSNFDYEDVIMGMETGGIDTHDGILARDVRLKRLVEYVDIPGGSILDIGCGGGTITNFLADTYPNTRVSGCDISKSAISIAKKHAHKRTSFGVIADGKFPYKDKFFDACICFDVLEHVPDPDLFLSETKRVLKKGGLIYFAVPCEG
ncbi:MAG: methyltransferase domain-containing protein, partial [Pseudomonadota bacterium]